MIVPNQMAHQTYQSLYKLTTKAVENFRSDLVEVDAAIIYANPKSPFVHVAHETGTHLYLLPEYSGSNDPIPYLFSTQTPLGIAKGTYGVLRYQLSESALGRPVTYTYFNGSNVRKIRYSQCVDIYKAACDELERSIPVRMRRVL